LWAAQVGGSKKRRQAATPFRPARFTETDSMKHFLIFPVLTLAALLAVGCGHSDPIRAEAPGGRIGQSHHIKSDGTYALYHVTQWTDMGQPKAVEKIAAMNLKAGDRVGFDYFSDPNTVWQPDAHVDIVAFAGSSFRRNLGPVRSRTEKFYWADVNGWDGYWAGEPERGFFRMATAQ
jgi:hypothetical protein